MFLAKDIIKKGNPLLKEKSLKVSLPLSKEDEDVLKSMAEYVFVSQHDDLIKKYNIRPGVGLSAVQVGVNKRMFCINCIDTSKEKPTRYVLNVINPVILNKSKELTYLNGGEGCLSIDENTSCLTPRHKKITFKAHLYDLSSGTTKLTTMTLEGYIAIVFQHEFDHLDGILFIDNSFKELKNINPLFDDCDDEDE